MDEPLEAMCVVTKNLGVAFGGQRKPVDVISDLENFLS